MGRQTRTTFSDLVDFSGTTHAGLKVNSLTTTQRDALVGVAVGSLIYNTTTGQLQRYEGAQWRSAASRTSVTVGMSDADYICDGVADDVQIQAACTAVSTTGGTVCILPGTYDITNSVNISSYTTVEGSGWNTIFKMGAGANKSSVFGANSKTNVIIRNLQIDGNKANQTMNGPFVASMISGSSGQYIVLDTVYVHDSVRQGAYFGAAKYCLFINCKSDNNGKLLSDGRNEGFGYGFNESGGVASYGNKIIGCYATGNTEGGASLYGGMGGAGATNNIIANCVFEGHTQSGAAGVNIFNASNNEVVGCQFINNTHGIQVIYLSNNNNIVSNAFTGPGPYGIWVSAASTTGHGHNNNVVGNSVYLHSTGIYIDGARDVNVSGNKVIDNDNIGIKVANVTSGNVTGNTANMNGQEGISIDNSSNVAVTGNNATNNSQSNPLVYNGINIKNSSNRNAITGNVCSETQAAITTTLTATASAGQKIVTVTTAVDFFAGQWVTLTQGATTENAQISSITYVSGSPPVSVTMVNNLTNTYTSSAILSGRKTQKYGIRENATTDDYNVITSNVANGNGTAQISVQGVNTVIGLNQEV